MQAAAKTVEALIRDGKESAPALTALEQDLAALLEGMVLPDPPETREPAVTAASPVEELTPLLDRLQAGADVITYEFENLPLSSVEYLTDRVPVHPTPAALAAAQDRRAEKNLFQQLGIETPSFRAVASLDELAAAVNEIGLPAVLKTRYKVDDVVTTLMLNFIMFYMMMALVDGPWKDPLSGYPDSPDIRSAAEFPILLARTRLHLGVLMALLAAPVSAETVGMPDAGTTDLSGTWAMTIQGKSGNTNSDVIGIDDIQVEGLGDGLALLLRGGRLPEAVLGRHVVGAEVCGHRSPPC